MVSCNEADKFLFSFTILGHEARGSLFFYAEKNLTRQEISINELIWSGLSNNSISCTAKLRMLLHLVTRPFQITF